MLSNYICSVLMRLLYIYRACKGDWRTCIHLNGALSSGVVSVVCIGVYIILYVACTIRSMQYNTTLINKSFSQTNERVFGLYTYVTHCNTKYTHAV